MRGGGSHDAIVPDTTGMRRIEGGTFSMGSARFYPEERPLRPMRVQPFWIDETPVTNAAYARFVQATAYVTVAERESGPRASTVFCKPQAPVPTLDPNLWWRLVEGASWRQPQGPGSSWQGLEDHPVVHVALEDALAYARWCGKRLPTEAQWECAARGGLDGADYAWGQELAPQGAMMANYWQGEFPHENTLLDGWERTSPVRSYPANGFGLYDMIGNVWEWTMDGWSLPGEVQAKPSCCGRGESAKPQDPAAPHVIKGGSYLCARNHCQRFRPAARHPQPADWPTGHIGFRCVAL